jgi:hypothetical protein
MPAPRLPTGHGPFARLITALALLAALTVSFFLGAVLFLVVLGVLLILGLALYLRLWWLRRRWARQPASGKPGAVTLEGEYTVHDEARRGPGESR